MGFRPRGNRCRDGRQIEGMRTKRSHQQRAQTGYGHDRVGTGGKAIVAQHQHARHVLPCQGDQKQWQGHAEQTVQRPGGCGVHRCRQLQRQPRQVHTLLLHQERQPQQQNAHHRIARGNALEHHISHDQ